jgi:hypothetical protein
MDWRVKDGGGACKKGEARVATFRFSFCILFGLDPVSVGIVNCGAS